MKDDERDDEPRYADLPPGVDCCLDHKQVAEVLGICLSKFYEIASMPDFPRPLFGGRLARWPVSVINEYVRRPYEPRPENGSKIKHRSRA